ncbi:MAG: radical SAM protein [Thermoplasmata archaeon YP2-bin.285]|uniref:Radical SAM protein n=1 Tax=Candidatus Sysuiplasma superficiale TaxID=2823368 RepID=A0A8J7YQQ6_9ARCH|nr:radical SAM protein [Candidatus Sysuiplasma superficiale]
MKSSAPEQAFGRRQHGYDSGFKWIDFKITNRCNRRCVYCGVSHDKPRAAERLASETIASTLHDALDLGFTHYALLGGEPSLREDICKVFEPFHGTKKPKSLMVITNGVRFNEELYRSLFATDADEATLVFSMDSFRKPNYKFQDPVMCLRHIMAIKKIAEEYDGHPGRRTVAVHTVISRENFRDFVKMLDFFGGKDIDVSLGLVCPAFFLNKGEPGAYNEFTYAELEGILRNLDELSDSGRLNFGNSTLRDYLRIFPYGKLRMASTCRAGRQAVIINPDGAVFPCISQSYLGGKSFGNITTEPFSAIYLRMQMFSCTWKESAACWDHFLWDRLAAKSDSGGPIE